MVASERIHIPLFVLNNPLYMNIKGKVTTFALRKINEQHQKANRATVQKPLPLCTRSFSNTMGLPCAHTISLLEKDQPLMLHNIHEHWWIQEHTPVSRVKENAVRDEDALQPLLQNLQDRYQKWPKFQQTAAQATLDNMINAPTMVLQNPKEVSTRGRPTIASQHSLVN